jgi:PadR family transcriptional regulator, regulatory protein PadR
MSSRARTSKQTLAVLSALAEKPTEWHYGYALSRETQLMSGTLYPILMRLEQRGWLETMWETPQPGEGKRAGHLPRHMYRLTANGRAAALEALIAARSKTKSRRASALKPARESARIHLGEPMLEQS